MNAFRSFFSSSSTSKKDVEVSRPPKSEKKKKEKRPSQRESTIERNNSDDIEDMVAEVDENERWVASGGWSADHLFESDPRPFVCSTCSSDSFPDPEIADGWEYSGPWQPDLDIDGTSGGWMYAVSFKQLDEGDILDPNNEKDMTYALVRRRRWIRKVIESHKPTASLEGSENVEEDSASEHSASVGDFSIASGADFELEVSSEYGDYSEPEGLGTGSGSQFGGSSYTPSRSIAIEGNYRDGSRSSAIAPMGGRGLSTIQGNRKQAHRASIFGFASASTSNPALVIKDHGLQSINKQIRVLEDSCKKADEEFMKNFKKARQPVLKGQIDHLQSQCAKLEKKMESEVHKGLKFVSGLEDELKDVTEKLETLKKEYFFPTSPIVMGQGGVYCALDDVWVEVASGYFVLDLIPNSRESPVINLVLSGSRNMTDSGITVKIKLEGLKLAGDNGKGVPKLQFDSVSVTLVLRASIQLTFNIVKQKWEALPKNFQIQILSFKGPYGISKGVVSMILSLVTPTIRSKILESLPHELGLWMRTLHSTFCLRGEFEFSGIEIAQLSLPFGDSSLFSDICFYNEIQLDMFTAFQKSMDRPKIFKTLGDLIMYRRQLVRHGPSWETIPILWDQAARIYSDKIQTDMAEKDPEAPAHPTISFLAVMNAADDVVRKRLSAEFKLTHVDGQISLNMLFRYIHQMVHRFTREAAEKSKTALQSARLKLLMDQVNSQYELGLEVLKLISGNLDFAQLKINANMKAGPTGTLNLGVKDLFAQAPVLLNVSLAGEKNMGHRPLVAYLINFKPEDCGDIVIEVCHASEESTEVPSAEGEYGDLEDNFGSADTWGVDGEDGVRARRGARRRSRKHSSASMLAAVAAEAAADRYGNSTYSSNSPVGHHRIQQQRQLLADTMSGVPVGKSIHKVLTVVASSPHISMIVDRAVSLKPGAELFSIVIGPREEGWKPFGVENLAEASSKRADGSQTDPSAVKARPPGCPIFMQTALGIKMMAQVPKAEVNINLADLIRFIRAHFDDLTALKLYLEKSLGGNFYEEQLEVGKMILDRIAKYLLVPGLEFDFNLNGKIVATEGEILITLETPSSIADPMNDLPELSISNLQQLSGQASAVSSSVASSPSDDLLSSSPATASSLGRESHMQTHSHTGAGKKKKTKKKDLCAIFIHAELFLMDIFEDGKAVEESLKQAFDKQASL